MRTFPRHRTFAFIRALLISLGVLGCSQGTAPSPFVGVKGRVTLNDRPLSEGRVIFTPEKGTEGTSPEGKLTRDGTYGMSARPGQYRVTVAVKEGVDSRYTDPEKTPLKVTVVSDPEPGAYDFKLK